MTEQTDTPEPIETGPLTAEQEARAEALVTAGRILGASPSPFGGRPSLPEYRTTTDLYALAEYVLTGRDPMESYVATLEPTTYADPMQPLLNLGPLERRLRKVQDTPLPEDCA